MIPEQEILAACPYLAATPSNLIATFILPCAEIYSLCERTLKIPVLRNKYLNYPVSSKDIAVSKPN